jgi:hypothetical protein
MSNDTQIKLTPDFLHKIEGLINDYNGGHEYAIDRIVAEYEAKYGGEIAEADMVEALREEGLI